MYFPILKIFPWFQYMRVSTRITLVLPIVFSLFAIGFDFNRFPEKLRKGVLLALIFLGLFELNHAFKLRAAIDKVFPKEFYSYMDKIKNLRGEAILDWPFCIYGANINDFLCKHYFQTIGS